MFERRLCAHLGGMTLEEMRLRMDAEEYWGWVEYYNLEPFGAPREESKHGDIMTSMWITHRDKETPRTLFDPKYWKYQKHTDKIPDDPELEAEYMMQRTRGR